MTLFSYLGEPKLSKQRVERVIMRELRKTIREKLDTHDFDLREGDVLQLNIKLEVEL